MARLIGLLSLCCTGLSNANPSLPASVTLATHDLAPYGSYHPDGNFKGIAYDPLKCALDKLSIDLVLNVRPWRRAQLEAEHGIADGFFAGSQNSRRDKYAVKSEVIADQKWQWYLPKESSWDTESRAFRREAKVSSFVGANMQKWLTENNYLVSGSPTTTEDLAQMLILGRIDAALANNYVMDGILSNKGKLENFARVVEKNKPLYVYFIKAFIKRYPDFLEQFNAKVKSCRST